METSGEEGRAASAGGDPGSKHSIPPSFQAGLGGGSGSGGLEGESEVFGGLGADC